MSNQEFHEKYDNKKLALEELESLFSEPGYICLGHGTGRSGNSDEIVNLIFENGLRTKDNSLYFNTVVLSTPTPEIIEQNKELGLSIPTIESLKERLNNWEHLDSKKIIIIRIPTEFINYRGDRADLDGEMYGAFMDEKKQDDGRIINYLDTRFILGCYDALSETFTINSHYEKEFTSKTTLWMKVGFVKALKKTEMRLANIRMPFGDGRRK